MKKTISLFRSFLGISAAALLMFGCAEMPMEGGGTASGGYESSAESASAAPSDVASGAYGDTLEACLARIPSNSTDSQRMLAELTCQRDEEARQAIKAVPGN